MNIMTQLFKDFDKKNILYLSFKSNINLKKNFEGKADFDILVDKNKIDEIETLIIKNNGKRFNPYNYGRYPGVDNWLIYDEKSGIIYHLHLHYQLATGKMLLKEYVIPWEKILFSTRIYNEQYNIYISDPNMELLLLCVRCVVKSRLYDILKSKFNLYKMHESLKKEYDYLIKICNYEKLNNYIEQLFNVEYRNTIKNIVGKKVINSGDYRSLSKIVRKQLKNFRRYSGFLATAKSSYYRFSDIKNKFKSRKLNKLPIIKKVSPKAGLIIAFVGTDGAGKSTVTKEIHGWISKKVESKLFYMGIGDGKTTIFNSIMKKANKISTKNEDNNINITNYLSILKHPKLFIKKFIKMKTILNVEKNNVKKLRKMNIYRLNGGICILDRYPQIESSGQNDGPKMGLYKHYFENKHFYKKFVKKEQKYLSIIKEIKPDIVFRLNISPEMTLKRKDEIKDVNWAKEKIEQLKSITFQGANIYEINTEQPYENELLEIKTIIWRNL